MLFDPISTEPVNHLVHQGETTETLPRPINSTPIMVETILSIRFKINQMNGITMLRILPRLPLLRVQQEEGYWLASTMDGAITRTLVNFLSLFFKAIWNNSLNFILRIR